MKKDKYSFILVKFNRIIPYSADSFAFLLQTQQVFFIDDVANLRWTVVLRKELRSMRVTSKADDRPDLQYLSLDDFGEYQGLIPQIITNDTTPMVPLLTDSMELTSNKVQRPLETKEP
jgi:hypothetical protein